MISVGPFDTFVLVGFGVLIIWAAVSDIRDFIIPNRIVGAVLLLYPVHASASFVYVNWPADLMAAAIVFFVGAFLSG